MLWARLAKTRMPYKIHIQTPIVVHFSLMISKIWLENKQLLRLSQPQPDLHLHSLHRRELRLIILLNKTAHYSYHRLMLIQHWAARRKHPRNTLNWRMMLKMIKLKRKQINLQKQLSTSYCILSSRRIAWSLASSSRLGTQRWVRFNSCSTEASQRS